MVSNAATGNKLTDGIALCVLAGGALACSCSFMSAKYGRNVLDKEIDRYSSYMEYFATSKERKGAFVNLCIYISKPEANTSMTKLSLGELNKLSSLLEEEYKKTWLSSQTDWEWATSYYNSATEKIQRMAGLKNPLISIN